MYIITDSTVSTAQDSPHSVKEKLNKQELHQPDWTQLLPLIRPAVIQCVCVEFPLNEVCAGPEKTKH